MIEISNIFNQAASDHAILEQIGQFIKEQRLYQNKTQQQLAQDAGINRSTMVELEQGKGGKLLTLIQVLRALGQLQVLAQFGQLPKPSPLQLAEMQQSKRKRASPKTGIDNNQPPSNW